MPGALRNREPIGVDVLQPAWWSGDDGGTDIGRGFAITLGKTRLGQQGFRGEMLRRYGPRCAFTGPQPPEVLEAAHVRSYSASHRHERSNGLLLRRDLHAPVRPRAHHDRPRHMDDRRTRGEARASWRTVPAM